MTFQIRNQGILGEILMFSLGGKRLSLHVMLEIAAACGYKLLCLGGLMWAGTIIWTGALSTYVLNSLTLAFPPKSIRQFCYFRCMFAFLYKWVYIHISCCTFNTCICKMTIVAVFMYVYSYYIYIQCLCAGAWFSTGLSLGYSLKSNQQPWSALRNWNIIGMGNCWPEFEMCWNELQ